MVIGVREATMFLGFVLFIVNLVYGIVVLARDNLSKKFKVFLGISLIILSIVGFLVFLLGFT